MKESDLPLVVDSDSDATTRRARTFDAAVKKLPYKLGVSSLVNICTSVVLSFCAFDFPRQSSILSHVPIGRSLSILFGPEIEEIDLPGLRVR